MYNLVKKEDSIDIGSNVKVKFLGLFVKQGRGKNGPYAYMELRFMQDGNYLSHKLWQPGIEGLNYETTRKFSIIYTKLFEVFGLDFSSIPPQRSWDGIYTELISKLRQVSNKTVYIKTLPKTELWGAEEYEATLAEKDFISLKPDLVYSVLEQNQLDSLGIGDLHNKDEGIGEVVLADPMTTYRAEFKEDIF